MENRFYLYRHIRLDKNEPFYVGIGSKSKRNHSNFHSEYRRAYESNRKESSIWNNVVSKTEHRVEILYECDNYELIKEKEIEFISLYGRLNQNSGSLSNMTNGGDGIIGYVATEEKIENHRIFMTGRIQTKEQIEKRINSRKGYLHSEETKTKISESHKGKKVSRDHIEKLHKGQILAQSKPIDQYDLQGNFIKSWQSATVASKEIGVHSTTIRHCVQDKIKKAGGYIWKPAQISYK